MGTLSQLTTPFLENMPLRHILDPTTGLYYISLRNPSHIDLTKKLTALITDVYMQDAKPFRQTLQMMTDLRSESLLFVKQDPFVHVNLEVITKLKRFIELLNLLIDVFDDNVLEFEWYIEQAEKEGEKEQRITVRSLREERMTLLEQLSAYYSIIAVSEMRSFDDADEIGEEELERLRKVGIYFQYAAGCLVLSNEERSMEDHPLIKLLLGQAQEIYFMSAELGDFQYTVLVKLAMQASDFYEEASPDMCIHLKKIYLRCVAYELYATHCKNKKKLGDSLAYLYEALGHLESYQSDEDLECAKVVQDIENLRLKVTNEIQLIKQDRKVELPEFESLNPLPRAILVKCLKPKDFEDSEPNIFRTLIPIAVIKLLKEYSFQLEEFTQCEIKEPLHALDKACEEFGIYDEIINYYVDDKNNKIPESIAEYRTQLLDMGNRTRMNDLFHTVNNLKLRCRQGLDEVWTQLKEQTNYEESLAVASGYEKWPLEHIEKDDTGSVLANTFKIYENYIKQSEDGDHVVALQVKELSPFLTIYESLEQLKEYIPSPEFLKMNPQFQTVVEKMSEVMTEMKDMVSNRESFIKNVQIKVENCRYLEKCKKKISSFKGEYIAKDVAEEILRQEIMKFQKELDFVKNQQDLQGGIIDKFKVLRLEFNTQKEKLKVSQARLESVAVLTSIHESYLECIKNLNQGVEFYQNLFDNIVVKTVQVEQFLAKRAEKVKCLQIKYLS